MLSPQHTILTLRRMSLILCGVMLLISLSFSTGFAQDDMPSDENGVELLPVPPEGEEEEGDFLLPDEERPSENDGGFFGGLRRFFGQEPEQAPRRDEGRSYGCAPSPEQLEKLYEEYEML